MTDKKSFLRLVLEYKELNMNQASKLLGWSPQIIGHLCRKGKMLNTSDIPHICSSLNISQGRMMKLLKDFIFPTD